MVVKPVHSLKHEYTLRFSQKAFFNGVEAGLNATQKTPRVERLWHRHHFLGRQLGSLSDGGTNADSKGANTYTPDVCQEINQIVVESILPYGHSY